METNRTTVRANGRIKDVMADNSTDKITIIQTEDIPINSHLSWRLEEVADVYEKSGRPAMREYEITNRRYLEEAIPSGMYIATEVSVNGIPAAYGGLCLHRVLPCPDNKTGLKGWLTNIYTRVPFRRMGLGDIVVKSLLEQAKNRGVEILYLDATDAGKPLYEKNGFAKMSGAMERAA